MGEVINLRQARKAKARAGKEAQAQENRVRFGRTGAEKRRDADTAEREARRHEGHRIDGPDDGDDQDPDGGAA
ncbi:DUF4169 family protein [Inquilinus sp. Marseille-Q2685]|uniref:DUF4169 family protein n=1 Tax=Inquilinus sp. Marseille-Q2685 TaxID=2866581 RepID=UPI001CE456DF|nr:DUF4169 family protein [Inquilinus sp. Marseille-Q2685]